jgi:pimeloyl-ACP methyl ester carboxylesterase
MGGPEEITRRMQGMLRPGENEESSRLYSLEPFRKDKIPLILVHGLLATEETWLPFVNLLRADPFVRENYQIVIYNYPNGYAIGKNAYRLHAALDDFRRIHDPERTNAKMRRMVILGHSMGGILSDIQVRDSGDRVYQMLFDRPLAELELDEDKKAEVRRYLFFESNPDLTRVVFIASPHRGSKYASNPIGQVGSVLIRLPLNLVDSVFGEIRAVNALTTAGRRFARQPRNSVGSLRPDNPVLSATLGLPVREGVEMHSIIAQANWWRPKEEGSDLVVRYGSAHLDAAASEKVVVKAHHTSVLTHRETIGEVWRILRLHGGFSARVKGL